MKLDAVLYRKLILTLLVVGFIVSASTGYFDHIGEEYTDEAMSRALISFGVARGLNGIISVAQGTEIAIHPAGFGLNFTPGEILDPVNDLVEQFSWIMLMSAASIGIQKVFLNISSSLAATILLVGLLSVIVVLLWKPRLINDKIRHTVLIMSLMILFIRFCVPLSVIGGEYLYKWFLSDLYTESTKELERTSDTIGQLNKDFTTENQQNASILDKAKQLMNSATDNFGYQAKFEQYKNAASTVSLHAVNLIVVFLTQTVIFPLLFLWVMYRGVRLASQRIFY